jgi:hypothetical protein
MKTLCIFLSVSPNRRKQPERYEPLILKPVDFFFELYGLTQAGCNCCGSNGCTPFFCQQTQIVIIARL